MTMSTMNPGRPNPATRAASAGSRLALFVVLSMLAGLVAAGMALPFVGGAGIAARTAVQDFDAIPTADFVTPPLPQRSTILAANGAVLATIYYQNRIEVPLTAIAPVMRQAIVAVEDGRFYQHDGFDLRGFLRAIIGTSGGGQVQGGSTLTQQYVKQVLVNAASTPEEARAAQARTLSRKIKELAYALAIEKQYSKDEILTRYLNIAYFGAGAYGVEAASRRYFGKHASALNLVEAATLAGLVQSPIAYDPTRNPKSSQKRRIQVLHRMVDQGYITAKAAAVAAAIPTKSILHPVIERNGCTTSVSPFFCDYVIDVIKTDPVFGATAADREQLLRRGGLTIRTTLDPRIQAGAMKAVTSYIPMKDPSRKVAAISMIVPSTGQIVAMAQNRNWGTSGPGNTTYNFNVNEAMGGGIGAQAGSTFKIFTLAAALKAGISPYEKLDAPYAKRFTGITNCAGVPVSTTTVHNSTGTTAPMNMLGGTALSVNTFFMALEQQVGLCQAVDVARAVGLTQATGKPLGENANFTLGVDEVSPLSLTDAYATFANHGVRCKPIAITSIVDRNGVSLPVPSADCTQVIDRNVADSVTAILSQVIDGPIYGRTGAKMSLDPQEAAGKTGTTNDSAAVWFAGYTPTLAAAVWTGDPRGAYGHPMRNVTINGHYYDQVYGLSLPGPIWKQAMSTALDKTAPVPFDLQTLFGLGTWSPPVYTPPVQPVTPTPTGTGTPSSPASPPASPAASPPASPPAHAKPGNG
jgi:membrane peptidoglycan carboxypeptidase